jgi:hypothetical protein
MSDHPVSGFNGFTYFCNTPFRFPIAFTHFHTFISLLIHSILINLNPRRTP